MKIASRADWGARKARSRHTIETPTPYLYIHHTAGALDENGNGVWWDDVRGIQRFHMDVRGWSDIAYSFLVGGGQVFEGRGVGIAGGHTKGRNTVSHAICLIGNYESMEPTAKDLQAIVDLAAHGQRNGWWGQITGGHRNAPGAQTACPGKNLQALLPNIRTRVSTQNSPSEDPFDMIFKDQPDARRWFVRHAYLTLLLREPSAKDMDDRVKQIDQHGADWVWAQIADSEEGQKVRAAHKATLGLR